MASKLVTFLLFCICVLAQRKIYYEHMQEGKYLVAAPLKFVKDSQAFKHELGKHFHLRENKHNKNSSYQHEQIQLDLYPKTQSVVDIGKSKDKVYLQKLRNLCTTRQYNMREQKLEAFKKGPCSPVVIVPGILATSLLIEIDCQKLKNYNNGEIFKSCGWTTCSSLGAGIKTPDSSYLLWVGLSLALKVSGGYTRCFGQLFGLLYNSDSKQAQYSNRYSSIAGLKSTWFGNTGQTDKYSDCGANAIRDLSGYVSMLSIMGSQCALNDYGRLIDMLKVMGYQPGLTMQPLPYDFRYGVLASTTPKLFPQIINNLYYATGKKVVVIAHSLGTIHSLTSLAYFVTPENKRKMVRHYVPITPPWLGTVSAIRNMLYGDASYFTKGLIDSGINKYAQMKFSTASGSTYDLFLRDAFDRFKNESWMKQVVERINYQKLGRTQNKTVDNSLAQNGQQNYPMKWFPSKYQKCFSPYFKKNYFCETGFVNFLQTPIFEIEGSKYYGTQSDITRLINENLKPDQAKSALSLWEQTKVAGKTLRDMPAPGVNTSIIFTTLYDTQVFYNYGIRPKNDKGDQNTFIQPNYIGNSPGDISVPSWSALLFPAKWIYNKQNGNYTVNVIEYCANYTNIKQHYSTLKCECSQNPFKNQLDCTHPCIISDRHLIAFLMGILTNSMKGYPDENLGEAIMLNQNLLKNRINKCYNLQPNSWLLPVTPWHG